MDGDGGLLWGLVGVEWVNLWWRDLCVGGELCVCGEWCVCDRREGFERMACCMGGLSMLCSWSVLKEFDNVMGEVAKKELEKLGKPQPSQIHATLLLTNPAYNCVKDPIQLTWYQPACSDLSQQLSHWMALCPHFTALAQTMHGYLGR